MDAPYEKNRISGWRKRLFEVIFEADTPAGKWFDVLLILSILASVLVVFLDSVRSVRAEHGQWLYGLEWTFTLLFTVEYMFRILCVQRPRQYIFSFFGIVDFLGVMPTYLSLFVPGTQYFFVIRILRVQRIFRVMKLVQYLDELQLFFRVIKASRKKIAVFLVMVLIITVIAGSLMYVIEGEINGFTSIPRSVYWAIVTMTTVGYGDISPKTGLGQALAALLIILGYSIIVVPTGIVSVEMSHQYPAVKTRVCANCGTESHETDARYCRMCGSQLP
ncbi:ion transporter [bacterium]|nr:ion transporter [bacterium]